MLLQVSLLRLKGRDLILHFLVLIFLGQVRISHFFIGSQNVVGQGLSNLLGLSRESVIEGLLFRPKCLNLLLIKVKFLLSGLDSFLKPVDLTLDRGSECASSHCVVGVGHVIETHFISY